jgi:4-amino-4-deoxy-L-arabinose transferase-like glycosyltransferase
MRYRERAIYAGILIGCVVLGLLYPPAINLMMLLSLLGGLGAFIWLQQKNTLPPLAQPSLERLNLRARHWLAFMATLLSFLLLVNLAQDFAGAPIHSPPSPWWRLLGAGVLAALAWHLNPQPFGLPLLSPPPLSLKTIRWPLLGLGMLCLALTAEMSGRHFVALEALHGVSHHWQVLLLGGGMLCLLMATPSPAHKPSPPLAWTRQERALLLGITALAFGLRVWRLDQEVRLFVDELLFSESLRRYWYEPNVRALGLMQNANAPYSQLYTYGMAWNVELLGRNFWGLRMLSVLCGTMGIPALYLLGRHLFDRPTAAIAALLLASLPAHLHFSRIALNQVGDPLFGTLALAFCLRGLQTCQRRDYLLGALAWGMTAYFYEGGRIVYFLLVPIWLGTGLLFWIPRSAGKMILWALLIGLMVMAPFYYVLWAEDLGFVPRLQTAGWEGPGLSDRLSSPEGRRDYRDWHLRTAFGHYVFYPDPSLFYGGGEPLILSFALPFFFFGLAYCLYYWRSPALLLLIWVGGTALGNSLIRDSGFATRFANTFPALALLIALGLRTALQHWPPERWRWGLLAAGAVALSLLQANHYFNHHLPLFNQQHRALKVDSSDAILRALELPPHTQIYLRDEANYAYFQGMANFFRDDLKLMPYLEALNPQELRQLRTDLGHAFFLLPNQTEEQAAILSLYEGYQGPFYTDNPDVPPERAYVLYYLPPKNQLPGLSPP